MTSKNLFLRLLVNIFSIHIYKDNYNDNVVLNTNLYFLNKGRKFLHWYTQLQNHEILKITVNIKNFDVLTLCILPGRQVFTL